jgi:hypothetical protein
MVLKFGTVHLIPSSMHILHVVYLSTHEFFFCAINKQIIDFADEVVTCITFFVSILLCHSRAPDGRELGWATD